MPFPFHVKAEAFTFRRSPEWAQVYWYDFGQSRAKQDRTMAEPHLAVIISNTTLTLPGTVLICPITGAEHRRADYEFHVPVGKRECFQLDKDSVVKVDQVFCINSKTELPDQYFLCVFRGHIMRRVYEKLLLALNFEKVMKIPASK